VRVNSVELRLGSGGLSAGAMLMFIDATIATRVQLEPERNWEDLDTAHEELQSTNEELETTNEELQSGNEELETMNEEMRARTAELDEARTLLEGVLFSVAAGVVVLDRSLLVRSVSSLVQECLATGKQTGPVHVAAINRLGRAITCTVTCSPLKSNGAGEKAVLLMEELYQG
jgi:two-component system, chemotaxis family, CheB/CheR fusion protein